MNRRLRLAAAYRCWTNGKILKTGALIQLNDGYKYFAFVAYRREGGASFVIRVSRRRIESVRIQSAGGLWNCVASW